MRLTKLKLAGFKSFVDPTTIALPGQLVGVVGPNGCGKSNVMDSVRWVLGESKASELRGESMQDVIFNGSGSRKPVSRAAVELVFDNSLGRLSGQWSQYTELSVKRMLTRNGQSEYYINNLHVRRRDVTDLFLGTGLGPRAYAIIGQGTISRLIEARPDELRVFLEEAAGVTRYKERRKETERRLSDTRENLTRVEDIRLELATQMERLESQAGVARQYRDLQNELTGKQHLLWLLRRQEAQSERERLAGEIDQAVNALEARHASLRELEARLEEAREGHFAASDNVHAAQGRLYATNAEVARLEAEIRHRRDTLNEYQTRATQLTAEHQHWHEQLQKHADDERRWQELRALSDHRLEENQARLDVCRTRLPVAEEAYAKAQEAVGRQRQAIAEAERRLHVEQANRGHAERALQTVASRRERLARDTGSLISPDEETLLAKQRQLTALREQIGEVNARQHAQQQALPTLEQNQRASQLTLQQMQKERAEVHARRIALQHLQQKFADHGQLADWLRRHGIADDEPLWHALQVDPGWQDALEAALRERLTARSVATFDAAWANDRPGVRLTLAQPESLTTALDQPDDESLLTRIRCTQAAWRAILAEWLAGVRTAPDLATALSRRAELSGIGCWVTPTGDLVSRHSVTLFSPDPGAHGLLERQREIDALATRIDEYDQALRQVQAQHGEAERQLTETQRALHDSRQQSSTLQGQAHALQVETLQLAQAGERFRERRQQIADALDELLAEEEGESERLLLADEAIDGLREEISALQKMHDGARQHGEICERALRDEREQVSRAEREYREAEFSLRECQGKLQELATNRELAAKQRQRITVERERCQQSIAALSADDLEPQLHAAVDLRLAGEQALAQARDMLETAAQNLRNLDEQRLRIEQTLDPLRESIGELKLKEQAAALSFAQFAAQLSEAQADEASLVGLLTGARASVLQSAINGLQRAIDALGVVNLAALSELEAARERKSYLDAQSADLTQAMETLENAIRRIDRETRELLQSTYDAVNRNFGELFPTLFGGGEARLIITGDEILDAGLQVMAQPPGKKNSSIQLLSGGEKALTAIALVFSMFQLNPAPFCLLDEVDAPLDDTNTERFCNMVRKMSTHTQFLFISHNKITMEMAQQLVGVTMQESGVSRIVEVDMEEALRMREQLV